MDRRKKGSGQITHVPGRKSPWRASVVDSTGKQKSRFFKTEKEAKAFLREVNADADKLAKNNWMRDDEIRAYEEECKRTYVPKKYTKYAGKELLVHTGGYKLLFILHTGLRVGEALALTWADYDDYSKTILIDKNMVYVDGEKITQTPKTESGERVIVLNKQAVMDLQMLRKQFDEQSEIIDQRMAEELREAELNYAGPEQKSAKRIIKEKYDVICREHKYICGSSNFPFGSGVSCSTSQGHRKICKKIGLTHNVTVHGLRHTYVTHYYIRESEEKTGGNENEKECKQSEV